MKVQEIIDNQQKYLRDTTLNDNIVDWINSALREIYLNGRFTWSRKTAEINYIASDGYAKIPDDVIRIEFIYDEDGNVVKDALPLESHQTKTGIKWHEAGMVGNKTDGYKRIIKINPPKDKDTKFTIQYYCSPELVEGANDYLPIPAGAISAFMSLINWFRLDYEEETGTSQQMWIQKYNYLLKKTIDAMYGDYDTTEQKVTQPFSETGFPY